MDRWKGQLLNDEREILEGFQTLRELYPNEVNERHDTLRERLGKLEESLEIQPARD